ncbi:MAG TPA: FAD-binding oxidoreductase [Solirubrobacteraceae bacterium]|nr:FAD-binding oxidoreductase [Solirubrobacteraceae bacterium]
MNPALARFQDILPAVAFSCTGAQQVAEAIAHARAKRLPLTVRSGGHCFAGRSSTAGVLIDVSPMSTVAVAEGRATIGAGALLGDVYDALDAHGVTIPAGCGPTVGISGLTLGGGVGILGRVHGLTADALVAAEVVLADGRAVRCDGYEEADLFWALRGAGGARVGVVTSLEFATVPAPEMTAFETFWDDPAAVIAVWQEWAPDAPDALAASLLITTPPLQVKVFGAFAGPEEELRGLLDALGEPASATVEQGSARAAKRFLAGLGGAGEDDEGHAFLRSEYFAARLSPEAIAALVDNLAGGDFARELDFSPWGGAYSRTPVGATAFAHRDARFLLKHAAVLDPGAPSAAAREWLDRSWAITHPFGTGGVYPNFPEDGLDPWASEYLGPNRERLLNVKRRYDPDRVFG